MEYEQLIMSKIDYLLRAPFWRPRILWARRTGKLKNVRPFIFTNEKSKVAENKLKWTFKIPILILEYINLTPVFSFENYKILDGLRTIH